MYAYFPRGGILLRISSSQYSNLCAFAHLHKAVDRQIGILMCCLNACSVCVCRFLAIWYPLKCQITTRRARGMIIVIWIIALSTTVPWALFFDTVPTQFGEGHQELLLCREVSIVKRSCAFLLQRRDRQLSSSCR